MNKKNIESFENSNSEKTYYISTKINGKVLQPYKGTIDTSLVVNSKKKDYYPQLWKYKDNYLISLFNNKYLTASNDNTKVSLENLDNNKKQKWILNNKENIVLENNETIGLHVEGDNTSEDAMVVLSKPIDKSSFKWKLEEISIEIKKIELLKEKWDCKKEKMISGKDIPDTKVFTYSFWFNLKGSSFKKNEWKTVFVRGTKDTQQRTPGVFIRPNENRFHIRASTNKNFNEGIDTSKFNIEIDTWYYISIIYTEKEIQLYVNGQLSDIATLDGTITHRGDIYIGLCDCIISNLEFINKPLSLNEIIKRMNETNPEKGCKEKRKTTIIKNNLVKSIEKWQIKEKIRVDFECPPKNFGGKTITFLLNKSSNIYSNTNLLDNQYYDLSIWGKSEKIVNIRPYSGDWKGEWKTLNNTYKELKWNFLNTLNSNVVGFELNTKETANVTLFLPILKIKIIKVENGNIEVREFRSNGTHPTCEISDVGLNSSKGWCALKAERNKYYLETNFKKLYKIQKIITRGRADYPQWVTEYTIEYFDIYYNKWIPYMNSMVMSGNIDMNTIKTNEVNITTNKIRIYPVSYQGWPSMRIGFQGIETKKDECLEYKVKGEIEMDILEREKNLNLYNKKCKKISYYEYKKEIERERKLIDNLSKKLEKSEIDSKTYESKYKEASKNIEELQKEIQKLNIEKEIIVSNSSMSEIKLNEKCQPIKKDAPNALEDLLKEIKKINKDLERKSVQLEKIEKELKSPEKQYSPENKKESSPKEKKKLVKDKKNTKKQIEDLKKQLAICQSQFEHFSNYQGFKENSIEGFSTDTIENPDVIIINDEPKKYDIRHHRQYRQLIKQIKDKLKKEKRECKPFNKMDIRKHKDYPKLIQTIYKIAREEIDNDITKHKDYTKIVKEIENRTIREYGRKTNKGYVRCPDNCELLNEVDIESHPKFRSIMRGIVQKVIAKYGQPIPGTTPPLYKPCTEKKVSDNNSMNSKCLQNFSNVSIESFQSNVENTADLFDIKHHRQYPELVKKLSQKCSTNPSVEQIEKIKAECSMKLNNVDITKNEKYQKLLKAYNNLLESQKQNGDPIKLKEAYEKLKKENEKCSQNSLITQSDITRHPDINKYVLKSSLPIDLSVKSVYEEQIKMLKNELNRLQGVHDKCTKRFNVITEGFVTQPSIPVKQVDFKADSKDAKIIVNRINDLISRLDKKLSIDDRTKFEEIKNACRYAFNFSAQMDESTRKFVDSIYKDILAVENKEKKLSDLVEKYIHSKNKNPLEKDLSKMLKIETEKEKTKKTVKNEKKAIQKTLDTLNNKPSESLKKSKDAIQNVSNKLSNNQIENPKTEIEYLKNIRKQLENEKSSMDMITRELRMKYDRLKQLATDLEFKNKYMSEELVVLRKRCNDRIMKLWEENQNIRKSLEARENQTRQREVNLDKKQKSLEEREERLSVAKGSQFERYKYLENKIQQERSVTDRYKNELNKLRDTIEKQRSDFDNKQLFMNNEISRVKDECNSRVDRYRRMYEEGEKLLDELRLRSIKSPELVPKIDKISKKMNSKVNNAIKNTVQLKDSNNPSVNQQNNIDKKLLEDMNKIVDKVSNIEKKLSQQNNSSENIHWYNNKYATI